ncbi:MAG: hypothetical protein ABFE07_28560 [Armatimonadia bacterium]
MSENWIELADGRALDVLDINPDVLSIDNLADALAKVNRFTGHSRWPHSVALHSVLVSELVELKFGSRAEQLGGLLHDGPEMVTNDIGRPVKGVICGEGMRRVTHELEGHLSAKYGAKFSALVKECDNALLGSEAVVLMPSGGANWNFGAPPDEWAIERLREIGEISWRDARNMFVFRFHDLAWWLKEEARP